MELRQLEYFAAVARRRHFSRAADDLYVTQSALSQQIRRLEAELGLELLRRSPGGVELTAAGGDLLARAETILAEVARARAEVEEHAGARRGIVRVAAAHGDAAGLPEALAAFHREHPGVRVALRQGAPGEVVELLRRGSVDLAVAAVAGEIPGVRAEPLADQPLRALLAPGEDPAALALWDLRDRPLILPEPETALREAVMAACAQAGFSPVPLFEVGDPWTVRFLAGAGLGVAIAPASWLQRPGPEVVAAALAEPAPRLRVALLAPAGGPSPAGELLAERLRAALGSGP